MSVTDEYLRNNAQFIKQFVGGLPLPPNKRTAVLACMDARLDVYRILGLSEGDSHIIRNAGGLVTQDALRSLAISQHLLGTREIILLHHTDCGMLTFTDNEFLYTLQDQYGVKPNWAPGSLRSVHEDVAQSLRTLKAIPYLNLTQSLRGFVFDIMTGKLEEIASGIEQK